MILWLILFCNYYIYNAKKKLNKMGERFKSNHAQLNAIHLKFRKIAMVKSHLAVHSIDAKSSTPVNVTWKYTKHNLLCEHWFVSALSYFLSIKFPHLKIVSVSFGYFSFCSFLGSCLFCDHSIFYCCSCSPHAPVFVPFGRSTLHNVSVYISVQQRYSRLLNEKNNKKNDSLSYWY